MKQAMDNFPSQLRFGNGNHGEAAFRGIQEAFPDGLVAPHRIYQDIKPCHPYALGVVSGLEERIPLKNHSHGHGQGILRSGTGQWEETLTGK